MYDAGASLVRWSSQSHLLLREGLLQPVVGSQIHHEAVSWMANGPDERRFFRGREGESDGARTAGLHHWTRGTFDGEFSVRENKRISQYMLSSSMAPRLHGHGIAHLGPGAHELDARLVTHISVEV